MNVMVAAKHRMCFAVRWVLCVVLCAALAVSVLPLRAAAVERLEMQDANISFSIPDNWYWIANDTKEKDLLGRENLERIGRRDFDIEDDFEKNHGYFLAITDKRKYNVYISTSMDVQSQRIFSTADGDHSLISEYLNNPKAYKYMREHTGVKVSKASDRMTLGDAVFHVVEYDYDEGHGHGICFSAVVNGKYLSVDFYNDSTEIGADEKKQIKSFMNSVSVIQINERPTLETSQIVILAAVGFLLLVFFIALARGISRKKRGW